jgi:hypothetical protein
MSITKTRLYDPTDDNEFGELMLTWMEQRLIEDADEYLRQHDLSTLDESRSICSSLLSCAAYQGDNRLRTFRDAIEAAYTAKIEDLYPACPICLDPIDYCQGHGEQNSDEPCQTCEMGAPCPWHGDEEGN